MLGLIAIVTLCHHHLGDGRLDTTAHYSDAA